jgi:NAD(P)-dependent dehydrogenase (short-subunit alcohol dehydrogenase family)
MGTSFNSVMTKRHPRAARTALIVLGCEGALGTAVLAHAPKGMHVIGVDRHVRSGTLNSEQYYRCDFGDRRQLQKLLDALPIKKYEQLILISCVGKFGAETFSADNVFDPDILYQSLQVNLLGVAHFVAEILSRSHQIPKKRIVVVGSAAAHVGSRDLGYGIAKAGLNGLVVSLSKVLASRATTVIGINPGAFESPMSAGVSQARRAKAVQSTHIQRGGTVDEIGNLVHYAAFEAPDYMTGAILNINGGQYA